MRTAPNGSLNQWADDPDQFYKLNHWLSRQELAQKNSLCFWFNYPFNRQMTLNTTIADKWLSINKNYCQLIQPKQKIG